MAPPKPPNPSSKKIIKEVVRRVQLHLNNALQENQLLMDERFNSAAADLRETIGQLNSQMENERNVADNHYNALMTVLTKLVHQREQQPTFAQATPSSSSITQKHNFVSMNTASVSHIVTPSQTPTRTSPVYSHSLLNTIVFSIHRIPTVSPPSLTTYNHFSQTIPTQQPYLPTYLPSGYTTNQNFNFPFSQQSPYHQAPQPTFVPHFCTPKLELNLFDGSNPLEWLF